MIRLYIYFVERRSGRLFAVQNTAATTAPVLYQLYERERLVFLLSEYGDLSEIGDGNGGKTGDLSWNLVEGCVGGIREEGR